MKMLLTLALAATGFAETHRFEPKEFYNTFSGAHTPVLRIKPGDHVVTSTIDARGVDSAGVQRGQGPNPETRHLLHRRRRAGRHSRGSFVESGD